MCVLGRWRLQPGSPGSAPGSTISAVDTERSRPLDGRFTTSPLTTIVEDPPPSRFSAETAPSLRKMAANFGRDTPTDHPAWRPSTTTIRIFPPAVTPTPVRGLRLLQNDVVHVPTTLRPLATRMGEPPTASHTFVSPRVHSSVTADPAWSERI